MLGSSAPVQPTRTSLRLAELLAAVSLATDLADGSPIESALAHTLTSVNLATMAGMGRETIGDVYYLSLLYSLGCTSASSFQASVAAGDDISARRWLGNADYTDRMSVLRLTATKVTAERGPLDRAQAVLAVAGASTLVPEAYAAICEVGALLAERIGASRQVVDALGHAFARWDGRVLVALPSGEGISEIARLVHLVYIACTFHRVGGREAADEVVRKRSGGELDPRLSDLWLRHSAEVARPLGGGSIWEEVLAAEPEPRRLVPGSHIEAISSALGDFADLKVRWMAGHSQRVAGLVGRAAEMLGMDRAEVTTLRRAARLHDLGTVSVPNRVWHKPGPLNRAEWEQVRLHPYHTQRVLSEPEPLRVLGELAGMHHEKLDGSGYHRALPAAAIPPAARLLAAAEAFQSMQEARPWRPPLAPSEAGARTREEVRAGRLDRRMVEAVLSVAGEPSPGVRAARTWPAGLTDREVEVLRLIAGGRSNREIARALHVSEATVHTHVINVYGKTEVRSRAAATLYAVEHDLLQP